MKILDKPYLLGVACVLIAALAWSTAGLFTRVVSTDIPTTLLWRSTLGGLCILAIYLLLNRNDRMLLCLKFNLAEVVIALISALGMMSFISAFFYTSIANVSFVYGAMPLVTLVLARIVLGEMMTSTAIFATAISAIGVAVLVWGGQDWSDFFGLSLAFLMTFFMAAVTVAAKFFPKANAMKAAYLSGFMAAIMVLPFAQFGSTSGIDMVWLALYGVVNVGLGFGVYLIGVARVPTLAAALIGLIEIPLAPIWAFLLFDEKVTTFMVIGGILVMMASVVYTVMNARQS